MVHDAGLAAAAQNGHTALSYSIRQFEGPLDLLLHLIQKAQINIYDIPIAEITDQFIRYLDGAGTTDLDDLTEFYAMAAHLIYMKSRMLIPTSDDETEDDSFLEMRSELVERLLDYQKFKRYTSLLADSSQGGELFIQRRKSQFMLPFEDQELWNGVTVWDLLQSFTSLLRSITPEQVFNVYEEVTTKQKLTLMAELFELQEEISFIDIVVRPDSAMDIICAFLAILEAVKFSMVTIRQHALFGDIVIRRNSGFDISVVDEEDYGDEEPYESFLESTRDILKEQPRMEHEFFPEEEETYDEVIDLEEEDDA